MFSDVTQLTAQSLPRASAPMLLTAGFPCQNISAGGQRNGLHGERSCLFFQVPRLLDELGPSAVGAVLLENSPCIRGRGLPEVLQALEQRGFRCRWGIFSPAELGAPQRRWRWYLLGVRAGFSLGSGPPPRAWAQEPPPEERVTTSVTHEEVQRRCGMLGNSVCPPVVLHAVRCLQEPGGRYARADAARLRPPATELRVLRPGSEHEVVRTSRFWSTPVRHPIYWQVLAKELWLGKRSCRNLYNQLVYEAATRAALGPAAPERFRVNPAWVEWLMGYPPGYTLTAAESGQGACA